MILFLLAPSHEEPTVSSIETYFETLSPTIYETKTFYTTYTFYTTLFAGTEPVVSVSEQVITNVVTVPLTTGVPLDSTPVSEIRGPETVIDISETIITKTNYNTVTFYATLFSDTSSFVTPIEEIQTDISTITETFTITRTILPTPIAEFVPLTTEIKPTSDTTVFTPESESSVVVTQTLYTTFTNFVTLFQGSDTVVTNLEEIVSNVVTLTVPAHAASSFTITSTPTSKEETLSIIATESTPVYTTREVVSTQTHYLTLFNNDESILSSIEETITKYVTELVTPFSPSYPSYTSFIVDIPKYSSISPLDVTVLPSETLLPSTELFTPFSTSSETTEETTSEISTYHPELVPSIRTIYSTMTFYTTYYSDTSSIVASQEEVLTSYVTLFVPPSLITTSETTTDIITPTSTVDPSVFVFTTTDYSTLTLYTTLFSGDEIVVISSEHVVPEVITATITPSSTTPAQTSTKDESILTFLTTFTYYTTYFSGTDPVIASSESVVTQLVTIEAPPTISSTLETSIEPTSVEETIIGVSTATVSNIVSSFSEHSDDIKIIGISSVAATGIEVSPSVETKVKVESKVHSEVGLSLISSTPALLLTDTIESSVFSVSDTRSAESHITSALSSDSVSTIVNTLIDIKSEILLDSTESDVLPVTTTSILTEKTEIVGMDGIVTSLAPSDTLLMVTGADGFVTKHAEVDTVALSPVYIPETIRTEEIVSTTTSEIKPATVIELSDLLGGNTALGGDIGLAIKDIVSLITGKKNKTEESAMTEKVTESSDAESPTPEKSTESQEVTTEHTTSEESSGPTFESNTEKTVPEKVGSDTGEFDYPIFVLPSKETASKSSTKVLAPVYVPSETIRTVKPHISKTSTISITTSKENLNSEISKSVSTSVITGARTVFIVPTKTTSIADDSKERYSIEPRVPKIDRAKESSITPDTVTKEVSKVLLGISESSATTSETTKENKMSPIEVIKDTAFSSSSLPVQPEIKKETVLTSSMKSSFKDSSTTTTPQLKPSIGTSIVSGIRTVFFDPVLQHSSKSSQNTFISSAKEEIIGRANSAVNTPKSFTTLTKDGQTVISRSTSGATTIFFPGQIPKYTVPVISTRYITSVESITRTLALTTTRTYYTRDSTLTVPSVYTTTIPPRTFVSTIIGSRTILGILPEPTETVQIHKTLEPSERTTTVTTTTLIFNSIPSTVIRTLVLPTGLPTKAVRAETSTTFSISDSDVISAGTEKPAKPPEVGDSTAISNDDMTKEGIKPVQKVRNETYLRAADPRIHDNYPDMHFEEETQRPLIVVPEAIRPEDDPFLNGRNGICDPKCQPYKKEVCKEKDGFWTCQCRPGHARKDDHEICKGKNILKYYLKQLVKVTEN